MAQPITLGAGYDSFTAIALPSVLLPTGQSADSGTANVASVEVCTSYEALVRGLGLNVGYCVAAELSGSSSLPASLAFTPTSVCIVLKTVESTTAGFLVAPMLGLGAWVPTTTTEANAFFQQFGDSFVSSVTWGSMYVVVYLLDGQTPTGQQALAARLSNMNGCIGPATAEELANALAHDPTSVTFEQFVIGADGAAPPNPNDAQAVVAFAQNFAAVAKQSKKALLSFATTGYERLGAFHNMSTQAAFEAIAKNRNRFYEDISPAAMTLVQVQNQVRAIQKVYTRYGGFDDNVLVSRASGISDGIRLLKGWVTAIDRDPTSAVGDSWNVGPINTALEWGLPTLNDSFSRDTAGSNSRRFEPASWVSGGSSTAIALPVTVTVAAKSGSNGNGLSSAVAMGSGWGWEYVFQEMDR